MTHTWVLNNKGEVLCQKRSLLKDVSPGMWEYWFGGHMGPGQDYIDCAVRELQEETGIRMTEKDMNFFTIFPCKELNEFQGIFSCIWNGDYSRLQYEKEEIDEIKWIPLDQLSIMTIQQPVPWVKRGYEEAMYKHLRQLLSK